MKNTIAKLIAFTLLASLGMSNPSNAQAPALLKQSVGNSNASAGLVVGNTFYFKRDGAGAYVKQLWKTDGTVAGTLMVRDSFFLDIVGLVNINDTLYFASQATFISTAPIALWKSDGTKTGTTIVKTFPGLTGVGFLAAINNICYFRLNNAIWKTDGTDAGTVQVKSSVVAGSAFYKSSNDIVFFASPTGTNYVSLWKTDGTSPGTTIIKDSVANPAMGNIIGELLNINGTLFYTVSSGASLNLWRTDGTKTGTFYVGGGLISLMTNLNGTLYFKNGTALWKSDGTAAGTIAVNGLDKIGSGLAAMGSSLYLGGKNSYDFEPYKSDGTAPGTVLLKDIKVGGSMLGSSPMYFTRVNNNMCFVANDSINGNQIWKTDGTTAGTVMAYAVKDTISKNVAPTVRIALNNYLLFIQGGGTTGDLYSILVSTGSTGIYEDFNALNSIKMYPNPTTGIFNIEWSGNKNASVKVFNILGNEILSEQVMDELNLSNEPTGIYFVKIQDGMKIYSGKIVVH